MENQQEEKSPSPPYLSWMTISNYFRSLYQAIPTIIDTSGMYRMSGSNRNLVLNALKYLTLIDKDGKPKDELKQLVEYSTEPEHRDKYQQILKQVLQTSYPMFFNGFNLSTAYPNSFSEKFKNAGLSGETVRKAEKFFLDAAKDAGLTISPHILGARKRGPKRSSSTSAKPKEPKSTKKKEAGEEQSQSILHTSPDLGIYSKWYETLKPAFDKLPPYDKPNWTKEERDKWITATTAILDLYITINDGGNE